MKTKLLIMGVMLSAVLVAWNHLSFGQDDDIPPVPVEKKGKVGAPMKEVSVADEAEPEQIELATQKDMAGFEQGEGDEGEDLITISLDNAPLSDVVRMFSRISGANIVAGTNLVGTVTVSMHDVPWEPALRAILDSVDLVLVEKTESIYSIVSKSELAAEPVTVETMFLQYGSVSNIVPVVEKMLVSTNASVAAFPSANALVVQETAQRLNEIRQTVKAIDKPRAQVYIETKFIELNDSAIEDLGLDWQVLQGYTVTAGNLQAGYRKDSTWSGTSLDTLQQTRDDSSSSSRNVATTRNSNNRSRLFDADGSFTDPGGNQQTAAIAGRNTLPTFTRSLNPGVFREGPGGEEIVVFEPFVEETVAFANIDPVEENSLESITTSLEDSANALSESFSRVLTAGDTEDIAKFYGATLGAEDLAVTLSALKQIDGVSIMSNPKVVVANGETATIHVGRNDPNVTAVPQGDTGDRFAIALDEANPFIETGVKLEVTPTVNTEDNIGVKIVPELSRVIGQLDVGAVGVSYPITQVRKITTDFQLQNGKTVAIGGLTETTDRENINKVPLLGDIPVIGKYLFTHKHMERIQDEVVIFVTVGLAEAKDLVEVSGIPSEGLLIHKHLANKSAAAAGEEE